jgi:hypothetical protein
MTPSSRNYAVSNLQSAVYPGSVSEIRPDMLFREAGEVYIQSRMLVGTQGMVRGPQYIRATTLTGLPEFCSLSRPLLRRDALVRYTP